MSLPPVVVGLFLYITFSNSGILGFMDLLYSPTVMIIAQFIIITPIITSLTYKIFENKYNDINEYMTSLNATKDKLMYTIILETRFDLVIVSMTGLGRALSEVGAVIIVGGNISSISRVMTTSIVLETSRGEIELAMHLGLSLIFIAILINIFIFLIRRLYL
jgi:tungstate transport system permease protein